MMDERIRMIFKINRNFEMYKRHHFKKQVLNSTEELALHLIRHNEGISQDKLSDMLGVDKGLVTKVVCKLEKESYVVRKQDDKDKRFKHLYATAKAETLKTNIVEVEEAYFSLICSCLKETEREAFLKGLTKIYQLSKQIRKSESE